MRSFRLAIVAFVLTTLGAQTQSKRVEGTVRDEAGAPIARARVRIEFRVGAWQVGALAVELDACPLPETRSNERGEFALVLEPAHQRFTDEIHGRFALVVETQGRQAWREPLPAPLGLYDGSDVVLPKLRDEDLATVRVPDAPAGAVVRLARVPAARYPNEDVSAAREQYDFEVPADGTLRVHVPLLPNPLVLPGTQTYALAGWTVQLLAPGRTTPPQPITAGDAIGLHAPTPRSEPAPAPPDTAAERLLCRLPDDSLRWFPAEAGVVVDDPLLPVCAIALTGGTVVPWPRASLPSATAAPRTLRCTTPAGALVPRVRLALHAHADMVWSPGARTLRPVRPAPRHLDAATGALDLGADVPPGTAAWITAPGHAPAFVWDLRALPTDGRVELVPHPNTVRVTAKTDDGQPFAKALVYVRTSIRQDGQSPHGKSTTTYHHDAVLQDGDGRIPTTDDKGVCELSAPEHCATAVIAGGWAFDSQDRHAPEPVFTGTKLRTWRARAVRADGTPVPFASLGWMVWEEQSGGSSGHMVTAIADSRGIARFLVAGDLPPKVTAGELGGFEGRGVALAADRVTDVPVPRDAIVALRNPKPSAWMQYTLGWRASRPGRTLGGSSQRPSTEPCHVLLLRWPDDLTHWLHSVAEGPPVAVTRDEALRAPVHVLDRTQIRRRLPLHLEGHLPADLAPLQAVAAKIAGHPVSMPGDYLDQHRALTTRDLLEHQVWLSHPETVPVLATIPAGGGSGQVKVGLEAGVPCTLSVKLSRPLRDGERLLCVLQQSSMYGNSVKGTAELRDPRLHTAAAGAGIELPAPFALQKGQLALFLLRNGNAGPSASVRVRDDTAVRVDLADQ